MDKMDIFKNSSFIWLAFYVEMYLVKRGTKPRNKIRNQILQYGVIWLVVNGQNGHIQKFMIYMAFF